MDFRRNFSLYLCIMFNAHFSTIFKNLPIDFHSETHSHFNFDMIPFVKELELYRHKYGWVNNLFTPRHSTDFAFAVGFGAESKDYFDALEYTLKQRTYVVVFL